MPFLVLAFLLVLIVFFAVREYRIDKAIEARQQEHHDNVMRVFMTPLERR